MAQADQPAHRLVGDIGGTNTRLALFDATTGELSHFQTFNNADLSGLDAVIARWLDETGIETPEECCLAVAAPPFDDEVTMLNAEWTFSTLGLKQRFGFHRMRCINDFEGNAYALPHLRSTDIVTLRKPTNSSPAPQRLATIGPGTGLGGATLLLAGGEPIVTASEPGHMGLAPATSAEFEVFKVLGGGLREVYAEQILSGPGILNLYRALASVRDEQPTFSSPAEITTAAQDGRCKLCQETLSMFCALLGSACGDYALTTGSYGGVYLAGGISPRLLSNIQAGDFEQRFTCKGAMEDTLRQVPLHIVTTAQQGLIGAAHSPL